MTGHEAAESGAVSTVDSNFDGFSVAAQDARIIDAKPIPAGTSE
jgi:hypothetical protein